MSGFNNWERPCSLWGEDEETVEHQPLWIVNVENRSLNFINFEAARLGYLDCDRLQICYLDTEEFTSDWKYLLFFWKEFL